jgi:RHS repeat-associated protein
MRDNAGVVHCILADHLGSSTTITDASGGDLRTMKYYPYGAQRSVTGDMITDKLYTGQQREPEAVSALGLYNYGARFYSTLTGRFVSADPVVQDVKDAQAWNHYSYVRDNPLKYVDPKGLCFTWMQTTFSCGADQLMAWLDTTLTSDSWLGEVARWGIQQQEFWNNFYTYGVYADLGWRFVEFMLKIGVTQERIDLIPQAGWETIGRAFFGVPGTFFRQSLFDLANGTLTIATLEWQDIVGARSWWLCLECEVHGQQIESNSDVPWFERGGNLDEALARITQGWGWWLRNVAGYTDEDLGAEDWSDDQRVWLGLPPRQLTAAERQAEIMKWCGENPTICWIGGFP